MDGLRRAGQGVAPDGGVVRWSVAAGARGRRWRWTVVDGAAIRSASLLELDPAGRFTRLEVETAQGMLTLHPDADRARVHGNLVHAGGVDPITTPWAVGWGILIAGDAFGSALCPGEGRRALVGRDGSVVVVDGRDLEGVASFGVDDRGVPILQSAVEWPLEA